MPETDIRKAIKQFSSRPIAYHKLFTDITGSVSSGLMLSQLVYWYSVMKGKDFYKTDKDFGEELGMREAEFRAAKQNLKDLNLVNAYLKGIPAKTFYHLNEGVLVDLMMEAFESDGCRDRKSAVGYIYLVGLGNLVKIGRTRDIKDRWNCFKQQIPGVKLLYSVSSMNTIRDERFLHETFKDKRKEGEWFELSKENIENIKEMQMTINKFQSNSKTSLSDGLKLNTETNKEIKKDIKKATPPTTDPYLDKLTEKEKNSVLLIFEFWNLHKQSGKWQFHQKISYDIITSIQENLEDYADEDICDAIANYALVLQNDRYFWDYIWSLSPFLIVKKDGRRKWWQFLPENFVEKNYLIDDRTVEEVEDPDPELTKKVIKAYGWLINNESYRPSCYEMVKFIKTTKKILEFYKDRSIIKTNWLKYLKKCLEKNYGNKGDTIYPGHMCSDHTFELLLPQYLRELGV